MQPTEPSPGWASILLRTGGGAYLLAGVGFVLDQITKMVVESYFPYPGYSILVIEPYELVRLTFVKNPGAAWGILRGFRSLFIAVAVLVSIACVWLIGRYRNETVRFPISLVLGGGLGNMVDRIFRQHGVVDFLDIGILQYRWPTFNVADVLLSVGMIWLAKLIFWDDAFRPSER